MEEVIRQLLARDLADFEGLALQGSVPVTQELANEVIAAWLQEEEKPTEAAGSGTSGAGKPKIPPALIKQLVKRLQIRFVEGKMIADFEIRR